MVYNYCGFYGAGMMGYTGGLFGLALFLLLSGLAVLVWIKVFNTWNGKTKKKK